MRLSSHLALAWCGLALAPLLMLLSTSPSAAQPAASREAPTLSGLLERFAAMPGLTARFREEKQIALLAVPVRSEGVIHFAPPGRLLRKVTGPTPSVALLEGEQLTFASAGDRQVVQLGESPVLAGFVDSFRHVLAGDQRALERTYRVSYSTEGARWKLVLRPRNAALRRFMERMVLEGEGFAVEKMTLHEVSGDRTTTELHDVNPRRRFSRAEAQRIFRVPD